MFEAHPLILADLRARMAEPQRVYHGQSHVDALLDDFRARRDAFHMPDAVELAIWFHDAVYMPGARDNEERSAALLREQVGGLIPGRTLVAAETMVRATEHHVVPDDRPASQAEDIAGFLDMDMAILAATPTAYDACAVGVAQEFVPVVGEAVYRKGRAAFLRKSLDPARALFLTAWARTSLDGPARSNMQRELISLS